MTALLEVAGLDVWYGNVHAVKDMSLSVAPGEIVTIVGANGAGKSSLLKALLGLVPCSKGSIRLDGLELAKAETKARIEAGLVLVPEGRRILTSLSVEENLQLGAHLRRDGDVKRDIERVFDLFSNLAGRRHMLAATLSGGEQQMLAIGRAMLSRPTIMMLDEPSLGLSPLLVSRLFELLGELNHSGMAILLVEQNTTQALKLAARGYVLELGRCVLEGASQELLANEELKSAYLGQ